jgi:hypothetical protein
MLFQRIRQSFFRPFYLAIIPALLLWYLLPIDINQYLVEIHTENKPTPDFVRYADFNDDGITECFVMRIHDVGMMSVLDIYTEDGAYLDAFPLHGVFLPHNQVTIGDYDHNGHSEIYLSTHVGDSIFLHVIEPNSEGVKYKKKIFLDTGLMRDGQYYFGINAGSFYDYDKDGKDDLYININAGYSLSPRKIYRINLVTGEVKKSPEYCSVDLISLRDINGDGQPEILINTAA